MKRRAEGDDVQHSAPNSTPANVYPPALQALVQEDISTGLARSVARTGSVRFATASLLGYSQYKEGGKKGR